MIATHLVQQFRVHCDRCGEPAGGWMGDLRKARAAALDPAAGFALHAWTEGGCARELWLCGDCDRARAFPVPWSFHELPANDVSVLAALTDLTDRTGRPALPPPG